MLDQQFKTHTNLWRHLWNIIRSPISVCLITPLLHLYQSLQNPPHFFLWSDVESELHPDKRFNNSGLGCSIIPWCRRTCSALIMKCSDIRSWNSAVAVGVIRCQHWDLSSCASLALGASVRDRMTKMLMLTRWLRCFCSTSLEMLSVCCSGCVKRIYVL